MEDEMFKVSELPKAENIKDEDIMMIVQDGINKKIEAKKIGSGESSIVVEDILEKVDLLSENFDNSTTYSTEEVPVGIWINGKTLYRKIFQQTLTSSNRNIDLSDLNFEDGIIEWSRMSKSISGYIYIDPLPFLIGTTRIF